MNFKFPYLAFLSCLFATLALGSHHKKTASTDWPLWRGPWQNGVAAKGQDLPLKWSDSQNVLWKAEIPGRGHGSPIVVGNQVVLPTSDEQKKTQSVLCLNRTTGKLLWTTQIHKGGFMRLNKKGTHASGSPASDGKRLYVNFLNAGAAHTTALSLKGKILWQTKITNYVVHQAYASSPALHGDNLLIVAADNKKNGALACLDRTSGEILWKVPRPQKPNYASPVIYELNGRQQLIMTGCDLVSSYNPVTGEKLWEIKGATTECVTTTVTDGVHVYSSGGYPKNHVSAIRADGSGKIAWSNNIRVYVPSMIVSKGYLYAIADAGVLYCWKSDTGEEMWKGRLGGTFSASLALADGKLYAANEAGDFFVAEASPKQFKILSRNKLGDEIFASPVICGKRLFQRTAHRSGSERQEFLYCIGKK